MQGEPEMSDIVPPLRYVTLRRPKEGLGFNIVGGEAGYGLFISFLLAGGAADSSGQLKRGDEIIAINDTPTEGLSHSEAAHLLKESGEEVSLQVQYRPEEFDELELKLTEIRETILNSPVGPKSTSSSSGLPRSLWSGTLRTTHRESFYVRTLFDFDPSRDDGLPSRGLSFRFGDILHIINASDDEWWVARRVAPDGKEDESSSGIVPSKKRIERKERLRLKRVNFDGNRDINASHSHSNLLAWRSPKSQQLSTDTKKKGGKSISATSLNESSSATAKNPAAHQERSMLSFSRKFPFMKSSRDSLNDIASASGDDHSGSNQSNPSKPSLNSEQTSSTMPPLLSYLTVTRQRLSILRPIIILGPLKDVIIDDLLVEYPERFASSVPHTTRSRADDEVDGKDYYFVSRQQMENDIAAHSFVEAGIYKGELYGTAVSSVRGVSEGEEGKHCILNVTAGAIRRLQLAGLHPVVLLVRARSKEQIIEWNKRMNEEQAKRLFEGSEKILKDYGQYITSMVVGDTPEEIYAKVKVLINDNTAYEHTWLSVVSPHSPTHSHSNASSVRNGSNPT